MLLEFKEQILVNESAHFPNQFVFHASQEKFTPALLSNKVVFDSKVDTCYATADSPTVPGCCQ